LVSLLFPSQATEKSRTDVASAGLLDLGDCLVWVNKRLSTGLVDRTYYYVWEAVG